MEIGVGVICVYMLMGTGMKTGTGMGTGIYSLFTPSSTSVDTRMENHNLTSDSEAGWLDPNRCRTVSAPLSL